MTIGPRDKYDELNVMSIQVAVREGGLSTIESAHIDFLARRANARGFAGQTVTPIAGVG